MPELVEGDEAQVEIPDTFTQEMETAGINSSTFAILLESSCDDDLANSDPQALLAAKIDNDNGDVPPVKPQALADLVAGDNNLGLMLLTRPDRRKFQFTELLCAGQPQGVGHSLLACAMVVSSVGQSILSASPLGFISRSQIAAARWRLA